MSKLRENLAKPFDGLKTETLNHLEQITDDFSVKFAEWLGNSDYSYKRGVKMYKNFFKPEYKSTQELQQYFKDNIYGNE